jgi:uncharacterized protein (DUF1330 family)
VAITPNPDQFMAFAQHEREGEVVMLNLLKFKENGGAESYGRYGDAAVQMIEERGGKVVWMGRAEQVLIGDTDADSWDAVALVSYPSRKAFIEMVTTPEYQKAHEHREGGLERTVLIACAQQQRSELTSAETP